MFNNYVPLITVISEGLQSTRRFVFLPISLILALLKSTRALTDFSFPSQDPTHRFSGAKYIYPQISVDRDFSFW